MSARHDSGPQGIAKFLRGQLKGKKSVPPLVQFWGGKCPELWMSLNASPYRSLHRNSQRMKYPLHPHCQETISHTHQCVRVLNSNGSGFLIGGAHEAR